MKKKVFRCVGQIVPFVMTFLMLFQRFQHPDMTSVRWFMEFWHLWFLWVIGIVIGSWLYSMGKE